MLAAHLDGVVAPKEHAGDEAEQLADDVVTGPGQVTQHLQHGVLAVKGILHLADTVKEPG